MSYSIQDARKEHDWDTATAIKNEDYIKLYMLSEQAAYHDDMELAEQLRAEARKARKAQWEYDEHVDNSLC